MSSRTGSRSIDSSLQTAQYLTIGMNLTLVLAVATIAAGVALGVAIVVVAALGLFAVAVLGYAIAHVTLHRRVADARERGREQASITGALGLIRANLLLYGAFVLCGLGVAFWLGYI
jgi:protein-S-isoprenylcysteine O-methyltransferase Ste14